MSCGCQVLVTEKCQTLYILDFTVETFIDLKKGRLLINFSNILRPTDLKKKGQILFLSSKKGQTWQPCPWADNIGFSFERQKQQIFSQTVFNVARASRKGSTLSETAVINYWGLLYFLGSLLHTAGTLSAYWRHNPAAGKFICWRYRHGIAENETYFSVLRVEYIYIWVSKKLRGTFPRNVLARQRRQMPPRAYRESSVLSQNILACPTSRCTFHR